MTKKFISISKYPGTQGQRVYSAFFKHYGINASYTPIGTDSFHDAMVAAREDDVDGINVSMPYKQEAMNYLSSADPAVYWFGSCNTIVNVIGNGFVGYNTDYFGALHIVDQLSPYQTITLLGAGSMGSMFKRILDNHKFDLLQFSPRLKNWKHRHQQTDVIINCTSKGTISKASPLSHLPKSVKLVVDLAITPGTLFKQCEKKQVKYITGQEIYKYQFLKQFEIHTGITASVFDYDRITNVP